MNEWIAVLRHCLKRYQQGESSNTEPLVTLLSSDRSLGRIDSVSDESQPRLDASDRVAAQVCVSDHSESVRCGVCAVMNLGCIGRAAACGGHIRFGRKVTAPDRWSIALDSQTSALHVSLLPTMPRSAMHP
jgi:hypothetical protein